MADPSALIPFMLIGFLAQLVDGALGMAYGQISSTMLISMGVPPAAASASVHTAETFTTAVSGISHVAHRNVDWRLFFRIAIPGMIGGVLGAYVLTQIDANTAKPFVLAYLTALGLYLFYRGVMHRHTERTPKVNPIRRLRRTRCSGRLERMTLSGKQSIGSFSANNWMRGWLMKFAPRPKGATCWVANASSGKWPLPLDGERGGGELGVR